MTHQRRGLLAALALAAFLTVPATASAQAANDPMEPVNRGIFWFNDKLDVFLLEPLAKGWNFIVPEFVQTGIGRIFDNAQTPIYLVNNLLQGDPGGAGHTLGRFVVNTTVGFGGFADPASDLGLQAHREDFGQTFGVWGLGTGPYLMLPVLGPSSVRHGVGRILDAPLRVWPFFVGPVEYYVILGTEAVNTRAGLLEPIATAKETSLDYYAFVRDAYTQRRAALVANMDPDAADDAGDEDLYYFDEEESDGGL